MPRGSARVRTTAMVCGWVSASTKKALAACLVERRIRVIASAAAVDSSSIDALAMSIAVRSVTIVRSEEHTSELPSLMRISYAVFCLKKKNTKPDTLNDSIQNMDYERK